MPFRAERFDADADERWHEARAEGSRELAGGTHGDFVLLGVRPGAETVLEIDTKVLDRLAFELLLDPLVNALGKRGLRIRSREPAEADGTRKVPRVGRVGVE